MKHGSNQRRGRSRGSGKRHSSPRNQTFDSNGPEGKVRGTPQQILDKYLSMARDAASAGEHITAESFYQFAEHYFRVLNADQQHRQRMAEQQARENEANETDAKADGTTDAAVDSNQDGEDQPKKRDGRGNGKRRGAKHRDGEPSDETTDAAADSESSESTKADRESATESGDPDAEVAVSA